MRTALTVACVLAAVLMIAVSASMNFLFMKSLATRESDGWVLGSASAAADVLKAALPWFVALAWRQQRITFAAVGSLVFVGFSGFSLLSALGFAADLRSELVEKREAASAALSRQQSHETSLKQARAALGTVQPELRIRTEMAIARQDRRWASSKQCTDATAPTSRTFCQTYLSFEAALVSSLEATRLDGAIAAAGREIAAMRLGGAGAESDPQVAIIARLLAQDRDVIRTLLIVSAALLVEVGSGLGLWLALGHSEPSRVLRLAREKSAIQSPSGLSIAPVAKVPCVSPRALPPPRTDGETVIDFCVDRVHPARDGGLTIEGLHRSYQVWCRDRRVTPLSVDEFSVEFKELAREMGVVERGQIWVGIRIGIDLS